MNNSENDKGNFKNRPDKSNLNETSNEQKEIQGSDADADQNIGKFNSKTTSDPEQDIKGSDADTDKNGNQSI